MNYNNKNYSSTQKTRQRKDYDGYFYHKNQERKQDLLIKNWLKSKKAK